LKFDTFTVRRDRVRQARSLDTAASARRVDPGARVAVAGQRAAAAARAAHRSAKPTLAFYGSAEWKALLRRIIATRGRLCQDPHCATPDRGRGKRLYGDHIVELTDGGAPLDERNVLLRCASCHGRKTAEAKRARGGEVGKLRGRIYRP
jgi:5-methylcytosine-specific restriction enzyme A